jgi:type II secretory pathway pseudopilin PulG
MASVYDRYNEQPAVVKIIVAGGVALLGYSLYRSIKRKQDERKLLQAAEAANQELQQLGQQGITPSFSDSQFEVWSTKIDGAVAGCGTDEEAIYEVFRALKNEADVRKLISVFGIRYYTPCEYSDPVSYTIWLVNHQAYPGDLQSFLAADLDSDNIAEINSILASKGINYRF